MRSAERIRAVALKEWRLNFRFPMEYLASNVVSPIKSAVLMYLIYRGLLVSADHSLGKLTKDNFQLYVILGTTAHSLFISSLLTFRFKMLTEKYWMTITATLVSPATILEVIAGFILGSVTIHCVVGIGILGVVAAVSGVSAANFILASYLLFLVAILGFGFGLIGATLSLVWEGKTFIFDYAIQAVVFMSCFYYPIETLPKALHSVVAWLPTFQTAQVIQNLYLFGTSPDLVATVTSLTLVSVMVLCLPALFLDFAMKKFGIVGY